MNRLRLAGFAVTGTLALSGLAGPASGAAAARTPQRHAVSAATRHHRGRRHHGRHSRRQILAHMASTRRAVEAHATRGGEGHGS